MKKSKLLLIAAIIGSLYVVYLISYFTGVNSDAATSSESLGAALATALVAPHMVITGIAVIFNWLGFCLKARWAALTAGILYAVAMVVFVAYFMFVIIEMVLCFIAFAKMKKQTNITE